MLLTSQTRPGHNTSLLCWRSPGPAAPGRTPTRWGPATDWPGSPPPWSGRGWWLSEGRRPPGCWKGRQIYQEKICQTFPGRSPPSRVVNIIIGCKLIYMFIPRLAAATLGLKCNDNGNYNISRNYQTVFVCDGLTGLLNQYFILV